MSVTTPACHHWSQAHIVDDSVFKSIERYARRLAGTRRSADRLLHEVVLTPFHDLYRITNLDLDPTARGGYHLQPKAAFVWCPGVDVPVLPEILQKSVNMINTRRQAKRAYLDFYSLVQVGSDV
jgi:hypothetical protein